MTSDKSTVVEKSIEMGKMESDIYDMHVADMNRRMMPLTDLPFAEYCARLDMDLSLRKDNSVYYIQLDRVGRFVCCFLTTSGGIIFIKAIHLTDVAIAEWEDTIRQHLAKFISDKVFGECIHINIDSVVNGYDMQIQVRKSPVIVVYKSNLYERQSGSSRDARKYESIKRILRKGKSQKIHTDASRDNWSGLIFDDVLVDGAENTTTEFKCYRTNLDVEALVKKCWKIKLTTKMTREILFQLWKG